MDDSPGGELHALAGSWETLRSWLGSDDLAELQRLHSELTPSLLVPLTPTNSERVLRRAIGDLIEAIHWFNGRWERWLDRVDLSAVNAAREAYNRYYLLEKECALGSARVARAGFQPLPLVVAT